MTTFLSDLDGLRECLTRRPDVLNFHGFRGEVPVAHYIVVRDGKLFPTIDRPKTIRARRRVPSILRRYPTNGTTISNAVLFRFFLVARYAERKT